MNYKIDIDDKSSAFYVVKSHKDFTEKFYCYAIKEKIITRESVPPLFFSLSVKGMSLSKKGLKDYRSWLSSGVGKACKEDIEKLFTGRMNTNLLSELKGKDYLIALNPVTILGDGVEDFEKNLKVDLNHERLHILYSKEQGIQKAIKELWNKQDQKTQDDFRRKHKSYNFKNEEILMREFFSYTFETDYEEAKKLLTK